MRFVTIHQTGYNEPGVLLDDRIIGLRDAGINDLISLISGGADAMDRALRWIDRPPHGESFDPQATRLAAPIPRPPKIICIGLNYRDHAEESGMPIPTVPVVFAKFPTAVTGHGHPIVLPKNSTRPDYEAELAVVIGKGGRHIREDRWQDHVFGYTIFNDVSARDFQMATSQWMIGKTFDTFAPFGPSIVTADEIEDPHQLAISLTLSGEVMQDSNTRNLIFRIPELIAYLSSVFTLEAGDIIATGTPPGVGFARNPPRYLKPGDEVTVRIAGLGELTNPVIAEA
ncbi:MAG TPA: fumarylacetoacetate hydrolase family protein [Bryobacteraceae bacterium]|nr:fumarylacetoacetate hydrolase family protein [Bryobacteraceae bacterium]